MQKQFFSRYSYIHYNKANITIGRKGEAKTVFPKVELSKSITEIQAESEKLSKLYTKNTKFPSYLGLSGETVLTKDASKLLAELAETKKTGQTPMQAKATLSELVKTASEEKTFEKRYYSEVGKYYGVENMSTGSIKESLKSGKLKAPKGDAEISKIRTSRGRERIFDYERYVQWFLEQDDYFSAYKLRRMSGAELNEVAQAYNITGEVVEEAKIARSTAYRRGLIGE